MSKYNLTPKKLIKILRKNGFNFIRQNGSHALFKNFKSKLKVIVPIHSKDLPIRDNKGYTKGRKN